MLTGVQRRRHAHASLHSTAGLNLALRLDQMPWKSRPEARLCLFFVAALAFLALRAQVKLLDPKDRYVFLHPPRRTYAELGRTDISGKPRPLLIDYATGVVELEEFVLDLHTHSESACTMQTPCVARSMPESLPWWCAVRLRSCLQDRGPNIPGAAAGHGYPPQLQNLGKTGQKKIQDASSVQHLQGSACSRSWKWRPSLMRKRSVYTGCQGH